MTDRPKWTEGKSAEEVLEFMAEGGSMENAKVKEIEGSSITGFPKGIRCVSRNRGTQEGKVSCETRNDELGRPTGIGGKFDNVRVTADTNVRVNPRHEHFDQHIEFNEVTMCAVVEVTTDDDFEGKSTIDGTNRELVCRRADDLFEEKDPEDFRES